MDKTTLAKWLKAGYLYQQVWNETEAGTPQGGIISPAIMNLTLDGLESELLKSFPQGRRSRQSYKVNFVRYCDDFVRHEARTEHDARASAASRRAASLSP
jgi:RNA-directed DNA polymerase